MERVTRYTQQDVDMAKMAVQVTNIESSVRAINSKLDAEYVTKDVHKLLEAQVELLQKIVYGIIGLILTTVIGGMVVFFINAPK
jgi:uncharacterized membrane-anchored protein